MQSGPRAAHALLLTGVAAPFLLGAWPPSVFVTWALVAAGLLVAHLAGPPRRAAAAGLATLAALALVTFAGFGFSIGKTGVGTTVDVWADLAASAALATIWAPTGVYLALAARDRAARAATVGVAWMGAWVVAYLGFRLTDASMQGDGHILIFVPGAALVTGVLIWRVVRVHASA